MTVLLTRTPCELVTDSIADNRVQRSYDWFLVSEMLPVRGQVSVPSVVDKGLKIKPKNDGAHVSGMNRPWNNVYICDTASQASPAALTIMAEAGVFLIQASCDQESQSCPRSYRTHLVAELVPSSMLTINCLHWLWSASETCLYPWFAKQQQGAKLLTFTKYCTLVKILHSARFDAKFGRASLLLLLQSLFD